MKKLFIFIFIWLGILTAEESNNISDNTVKKDTTQIETGFSEHQNKNIETEINVIKNRTGENKAGLYFKQLNHKNIILFLDGFWKLSLSGVFNIEFFKHYTKVNSIQPVFKQEANLSLWFLLNKKFYFEVLYKDKIEKSIFALGYLGNEYSYIKHIRAGNSGIKFPDTYKFINIGGGNTIAPGIMGTFAAQNWQVDTVLRYESSVSNSKTYYGKNELIKNKITINNWSKAKYFYIPSSNLYGKDISVFVKDAVFSSWRELSSDEFYIDPAKKALHLKTSFPDGVAISYFNIQALDNSYVTAHKNKVINYFNTIVPQPYYITEIINTINTLETYQTIFGKEVLILKDRKKFSPFEIASRYETAYQQKNTSVKVIISASDAENINFNAAVDESDLFLNGFQKQAFIQISNNGLTNSLSNPAQLFPFIDDSIIYSFEAIENKKLSSYILHESYIPASEFSIPNTAIPGTIKVYKNKLEIYNFTYNEQTNIITIHENVFSNDLIEIKWQEGKTYSDSGNTKFAGGIHWQPISSVDIFFAASGNWEINKQKKDITDEYILSTGIDFSKNNIKTGSYFSFNVIAEREKKHTEQTYTFKNKTFFEYNIKEAVYQKNNIPIFSNPYFYIDANIETVNKKKYITFNSKTEAKLDIWKIKLTGSLSLQNNIKKYKINSKTSIIETYGHSVTIPIYFFTAYENFFINKNKNLLSRENFLGIDKFISAKLLTSIDYNKNIATQKIFAAISPIIPKTTYGIFYSELNILLQQRYKTYNNISDNNYTSAWKTSLVDMYSKGKDSALYRNTEIKFIFNLFNNSNNDEAKKVQFLGVNFDAAALSYFKGDKNKQRTTQTGFNISFPFNINNIFIRPIWERKVIKQNTQLHLLENGSYNKDLLSIFNDMKEQYWLFSKPFLYDMFDTNITKEIKSKEKQSYTFINSYGVNLSRLISTTIKDLYTPLEFNTSISRITASKKIDNSNFNIYSLNFLVKYTTLNISGKYGYFDWFKWYTQDELNRKYNINFSFGKDYFKFKFNSEHSLYYFFENKNGMENKLGFENNFTINTLKTKNTKLHSQDWREKLSIFFIYSAGNSLPGAIIKTFSKTPLSNSREEKFYIEFYKEKNTALLDYTLSFTHSQTTKIGEHGKIKIFAELQGASTKRNSFLLNIILGITGNIEY